MKLLCLCELRMRAAEHCNQRQAGRRQDRQSCMHLKPENNLSLALSRCQMTPSRHHRHQQCLYMSKCGTYIIYIEQVWRAALVDVVAGDDGDAAAANAGGQTAGEARQRAAQRAAPQRR